MAVFNKPMSDAEAYEFIRKRLKEVCKERDKLRAENKRLKKEGEKESWDLAKADLEIERLEKELSRARLSAKREVFKDLENPEYWQSYGRDEEYYEAVRLYDKQFDELKRKHLHTEASK